MLFMAVGHRERIYGFSRQILAPGQPPGRPFGLAMHSMCTLLGGAGLSLATGAGLLCLGSRHGPSGSLGQIQPQDQQWQLWLHPRAGLGQGRRGGAGVLAQGTPLSWGAPVPGWASRETSSVTWICFQAGFVFWIRLKSLIVVGCSEFPGVTHSSALMGQAECGLWHEQGILSHPGHVTLGCCRSRTLLAGRTRGREAADRGRLAWASEH